MMTYEEAVNHPDATGTDYTKMRLNKTKRIVVCPCGRKGQRWDNTTVTPKRMYSTSILRFRVKRPGGFVVGWNEILYDDICTFDPPLPPMDSPLSKCGAK
jgi:hypothetical protein